MTEGVDLDVLAGPVRRIALDAADQMPRYLLPVVGALLARFHECGCWRTIYDDAGPIIQTFTHNTWLSRFERAGHASPKCILDGLRLALACRLLDDGWAVSHVAGAMNYSSTQAFGRWFRHLTGRTPSTRGDFDAGVALRAAFSPQRELLAA